jgi:branched-chain amino acid transport system permease protein
MSDETVRSRILGTTKADAIRRFRVPIGILLVALLLRPIIGSDLVLGSTVLATTILIWMLFAASFNLLLGYAGLLSFGHAMFLGIGVYASAIGLAHFDLPFSLMLVVGVIVAGALAYAIGRVTVHYGEIYFAMITLAFGMMAHFVVNANPLGLTGGYDGLRSGTSPEWISSFRGERLVDTAGLEFDYYFLVAFVFIVTMLLLWQVVRSPFGRTLLAVRDNEELAKAMGVATNRYKVWAFTLSGAFSAVAGAMLMINNHGASLGNFGPMTSAEVLLMAIFGGVNYFFGPLAGVFSWYVVRDLLIGVGNANLPLVGMVELGEIFAFWQFFFGIAFVIVILVAPREGIWGYVRDHTLDAIAEIRRRIDDV